MSRNRQQNRDPAQIDPPTSESDEAVAPAGHQVALAELEREPDRWHAIAGGSAAVLEEG